METSMFERAKIDCDNIFKKYDDLRRTEQGIYSCFEVLIKELLVDEDGKDVLSNIEDAELYNIYLEDRGIYCDPNTYENWMLVGIKVIREEIYFIYENEMGTRYEEWFTNTDFEFLEDVIKYIKKELDKIEK